MSSEWSGAAEQDMHLLQTSEDVELYFANNFFRVPVFNPKHCNEKEERARNDVIGGVPSTSTLARNKLRFRK